MTSRNRPTEQPAGVQLLPRKLRSGWRMVKLGDVVKQSSEAERNPVAAGLNRVVGLEHIDTDDLHIKRWDDIGDGTSFSKRFRKGQVLFGRRRAYLRKVAYAEFDGICSGDITVLESKGDGLLPELLPFIAQTEGFYEHTQKVSAGGLSPRAKWRDLATYEFALPPISEQRRIAEIAWAAEQSVRRWSDLVRASVHEGLALHMAFVSYGTSKLPPRRAGTHRWLSQTPSPWIVGRLADFATVHNQHRRPISEDVRSGMSGEYPYYGPTGILDSVNEYRFEGVFTLIGEDGDHFLKWRSQSMTIPVSGRFNVNNHAHALTGKNGCSTDWLRRYFEHRDIRQFLTKQGAGRLKLTKASLLSMPIAVPPPDEQTRVLALLDGLEAISQRAERGSQTSRQLLKTLVSSMLCSPKRIA